MIDTQSLRTKILDMAVKGNLYPENQNLSTVNDLLMQINERKEYLIKANVLKREKQLPTISDTEIPYELPNNWQWVRLGDYAEKVTDYVASGSFQSLRENAPSLKTKNYAILVKTADFSNGFTKNLTYTTERGYHFLENSNLYGGELILSNIGSIGKVFIVPKLSQKMTLAPNSVMIRLTEEGLRDYLYYFLLSPAGYRALDMISSGTAVKKFNKTSLKTILLPIPPVEEQKRIVCKVKELFCQLDIIDELQKQYAYNITSLNKKILDQAVMGKLVPQDPNDEPASVLLKKIAEEKQKLIKEGKIKKQKASNVVVSDDKPFEIPESWAWATLADLAKQITDGEHSTPKRSTKYDGYYLLSARNVRDGSIQLTDVDYVDKAEFDRISSRCNPTRGDILISCSGSVGRCTVVDDDNKYVMVRSAAMVSPVMCNPKYLMYAIQSECVQSQINGLKKQTAQANLFLGAISVLMIPVPPIEEQNRIVGKLENTLKHIEGSLKDSIQ